MRSIRPRHGCHGRGCLYEAEAQGERKRARQQRNVEHDQGTPQCPCRRRLILREEEVEGKACARLEASVAGGHRGTLGVAGRVL